MTDNKTKPTAVTVETFLASVSERRRAESRTLIEIMHAISQQPPVMWGASIIGFGSAHYTYDAGREGDMPQLGFSPRKASITLYFSEGFDIYDDQLAKLGKYKTSVSCLYINKLDDIDIDVLGEMIATSYELLINPPDKPASVADYINAIPITARDQFDQLRELVKKEAPHATEVLSYGIIGYKTDDTRAKVFISAWKNHVAMYPIPKDTALQSKLAPYIKGKGTLWFSLDQPLPAELVRWSVRALL